jgi:hypothetical protein
MISKSAVISRASRWAVKGSVSKSKPWSPIIGLHIRSLFVFTKQNFKI